MAELAVSAALTLVEMVLRMLDTLDIGQKVKDDIHSMKSWLGSTKAFIEDNYGREGGRMLEENTKKVLDIANDIEDVLEEFVLHSSPYLFHKHGICRKVHHIAHHIKHKFPLYGISDKIARIRKSIDDIKSQRGAFPETSQRPSSSSSSGPGNMFHGSPPRHDHEIVGYEDQERDFIRLLKDEDMRLMRLAVVGRGGSGKTTFVKNAYWKKEIRGQFECHAWVDVEQKQLHDHDVKGILQSLLEQFNLWNSISNSYDGSQMLERLQNYLYGKRYIIVLDNIWREMDWNNIFPDTLDGSRIIITTRSLEVASAVALQHRFTLDGLEWQKGWTLFCRKAFPDSNGKCPVQLKDCSEKIVARCEGLPLAIEAFGDALSRKQRLPSEWDRFHENLGCETWKDSPHLKNIYSVLLQDYMDLSSNLKSCFLYLSIFPEDCPIQRGRLTRLWVAEGFATRIGNKTAVEVADGYLKELINRNLIHVSDWDLDGRPRNCRVRNLNLKFIVQKCEDENFASIFSMENTSQSQKIRRLSVDHDCANDFPPNTEFSSVRSMFLMRFHGTSVPDFDNHLHKMKLLRVFDFEAAPLTEFPKHITNLVLIKYLSFKGTNIKTIPSSIKKLSHLETLDLSETEVTELPQEISHLHNLCHLFAYKQNVNNNCTVFDSVQGVKIHDGISNLAYLQDLSLVKVGEKGSRILEELKKLRQLRKLGLTGLTKKHGKDLCAAVEGMEKLRTLDLCTITREEYLELGEVNNNHPPTSLQHLYLKGRLWELPTWISSLDNLLRIALKWSKLQHSPMAALGRLPNLLELRLVNCYDGEELIFDASTFKMLKILVIEEMAELLRIVIHEGAMPDLKELSLLKCPGLKMYPVGINKLRKVEKLNLYDMDDNLVARLGKNGKDHAMVEHIPSFNCCTLISQSR